MSLPDSCTAAEDLEGPATIAKLVNIALLNSEAVEEPINAGAAEVALAATARVHSESGLATFSYAHPRKTGLPANPGAERCGADCRRARSRRATLARAGVAPGRDCICRAYRRPIIRSH